MELEKIILHEGTQKAKIKYSLPSEAPTVKSSNVSTYLGITIESWKVKRDPCWSCGGTIERRTAGFESSDQEMGNGTSN